MRTLYFKPVARLQQFLGRELIADPNLALAEFVKNSYDAGAARVLIQFELADRLREVQVIRVVDDGVGMDFEEFDENWMQPGFSQKAGRLRTRPPAAGEARTPLQRMRGRLPIGEKGIGRLAAGRLGDRLDVYTRKRARDTWLHIPFDWDDFSGMDVALDDVPIRPDNKAPPVSWPDVGTIVEITDLTLNWAGSVPGRRSPGREVSRIGRLKQDLEILVLPLGAVETDFEIVLESDVSEHQEFVGKVSPAHMELIDYRYDFEFTFDVKKGLKIHRRIRRAADLASQVGKKAEDNATFYVPPGVTANIEGAATGHVGRLLSGPFKGSMFYAARSGAARRLNEIGTHSGVLVYRDGIRVEPYGNADDDWLGAQALKASRQGYAAIRPNDLYGYVLISKVENEPLIDMTNREGLVENDAYEDFIAHMRAEFRAFHRLVLEEWVEPRWVSDEQRAQTVAERTTTDRDVLIRDIVHQVRQPVSGLGTEMNNLNYVLDNDAIPADTKEKLNGVRRRSLRHLNRLEEIVRSFHEMPIELDIEPVSLQQVVDEALHDVDALLETRGVDVRKKVEDRTVLVRPTYLRRSLAELLTNAAQAKRERGEVPWISVETVISNGSVVIRVEDNGEGVDAATAASLFRAAASRRGSHGFGLLTVRDMLATFRASARLTNPGDRGARFEITLPSTGEIRRELRS